jgi:Fic/DOC family
MAEIKGLRLGTSAAVKEKRLAALLAGRGPSDAVERALVEAQVRGSLELAGLSGEADADALRRAVAAVDPAVPLGVPALFAWQAALTGQTSLRRRPRERAEGPPPAPVEFIASRLAILEEWLGADSGRELKPSQQGALALARIVEILPFESGNGRVARLAASHLMIRAGARRPILAGSDAPRLREALRAAFQLQTEPLARLLEDGAERALDVSIAALEEAGPR